MIFDTHAHYDDTAFDEDRERLLSDMTNHGIGTIVNIGASLQSCQQTMALLNSYDFIYGAIGVHPSDTDELTEEGMAWLQEQLSHPKVLAVGEIGLDYHYDDTDKDVQKKWFRAQIEMARDAKLPMVIHSRDAMADTMEIMQACKAEEVGGVIHCFSYGAQTAKTYVDMGFYIGVGGVLTFQNGKKLKQVVAELPLEAIVLETDAPYLSPEPNRGKRNSSLNLPYVVAEIAKIKDISEQEVIEITNQNARKLYRM